MCGPKSKAAFLVFARGGLFVTQSSSPYFVRQSFWCVAHSIADVGLTVQPYHVYVPTFGEWGFVLASTLNVNWADLRLRAPTRFLNNAQLSHIVSFDSDLAEVPTAVSSLASPVIIRYYVEGWRHWR